MSHLRAKKRLLAIGSGGVPTGYARVLRSLLAEFSRHLEVVHFAPNLPMETAATSCGDYPVVPRKRRGDIYGRESLPEILHEYDPDIVFLCHDPGFWDVHKPTLLDRKDCVSRRPRSCVFYCPIQWEDTLPESLRCLNGMDRLVLYTKFGQRVVARAFAASEGSGPKPPEMNVIPHGLDHGRFRPLCPNSIVSNRQAARRRLFPDRSELWDAFVVLNANRNCQRKRIDLTMRAFAEFARHKHDAYLYLHMGTTDSGCDTVEIAESLGLGNRILRTTTESQHPAVSDERLNLIYNMCDIGVNTSTGEGWGLVSFEHAATGGVQVVPRHSACEELWDGVGRLVAVEGREVSIAALTETLEYLYARRGPQLLRDSAASRAYVGRREFSWSAIAERWMAVFEAASEGLRIC